MHAGACVERHDLTPAPLGLTRAAGKTRLPALQDMVVAGQWQAGKDPPQTASSLCTSSPLEAFTEPPDGPPVLPSRLLTRDHQRIWQTAYGTPGGGGGRTPAQRPGSHHQRLPLWAPGTASHAPPDPGLSPDLSPSPDPAPRVPCPTWTAWPRQPAG